MSNRSRRSVLAIASAAVCAFLFSFATPTLYAQELERVEEVVIFDATGKKVGNLLAIVNG